MNLLIWIEPFFIRNSKTTYQAIANNFARYLDAAIKEAPELNKSVRIFCNQATADGVRAELGADPAFLLSTNPHEEARLEKCFLPWENGGQQLWVEHMQGTGAHTPAYHNMLSRVRSEFPFDAVLAWGTNKTLTAYTRDAGALPLFAELGPLRSPFPLSGVLDGRGVNGDASIAAVSAKEIERCVGRLTEDEPSKLLEYYADIQSSPRQIEDDYILIPLQTSDDANLLVHNAGIDYQEALLEVAASASRMGKRPVIKTHPEAKAYAHTYKAERDFLENLASIPNVIVIDRSTESNEYLSLLQNAEGVVTFNSSVGFEASLLGTPTCVLARAGYAPTGSFAQLDEIYKRSMTRMDWLNTMKSIHWFMTERYLMLLADLFNVKNLPPIVEFWSHWSPRQISGVPSSNMNRLCFPLRLWNGWRSRPHIDLPTAMISDWAPKLTPAESKRPPADEW